MITGEVLRTRSLSTAGGKPVELVVVRPDQTDANVGALAETSHRWRRESIALMNQGGGGDATRRGMFASDVAFTAASGLGYDLLDEREPEGQRSYDILVAQDGSGEILGVTLTSWDDVRDAWHIDFVTIRPQDQVGWPNPDQVRGIGTEMLGEVLHQFNLQRCATVELEALDADAERFWRARGFEGLTEPLHMSCETSEELAERWAHTEMDDPGAGDSLNVCCPGKLAETAIPGWDLVDQGVTWS